MDQQWSLIFFLMSLLPPLSIDDISIYFIIVSYNFTLRRNSDFEESYKEHLDSNNQRIINTIYKRWYDYKYTQSWSMITDITINAITVVGQIFVEYNHAHLHYNNYLSYFNTFVYTRHASNYGYILYIL